MLHHAINTVAINQVIWSVLIPSGALCGFVLGQGGFGDAVCGDRGGGSGEQAVEGVGAVAGQFHGVGGFAVGDLDAVGAVGDGFLQPFWAGFWLGFWGGGGGWFFFLGKGF